VLMKFIRFLLFPIAIIYDLVTRVRNYFFDIGIFRHQTFKTPIIVVGNLSVGGTGKTPQIEYLIRLFKDSFKTAVLSRGYKRKSEGFVLLNKHHSALDVGDEPLQFFKKFNDINVAVDADRASGISKLINQTASDLILLDDAYQHRKVKGSFYILLTKFDALFTDDFLLPTGNLRESKLGANRADVIIVTKCPDTFTEDQKSSILNKLKKYKKEVFFTSISYNKKTEGYTTLVVDELANYEILLITGIANSKPLLNFLNEKNVNFKHLEYADHHHFTKKEITAIKSEFSNIQTSKKMLLTTEKDYVRLKDSIENISYLGIQTSFVDRENEFNAIVKRSIQ